MRRPVGIAALLMAGMVLASARVSAQGLTRYEIVRETSGSGLALGKSATATCPEDTEVLSGGFRIFGLTDEGIRVAANRPTDDGTGWFAEVRQDVFNDWSVEVTAICGDLPNRSQIAARVEVGAGGSETLLVRCPSGTEPVGVGADSTRFAPSKAEDVNLTDWRSGLFGGSLFPDEATASGAGRGAGNWRFDAFAICGTVPGLRTVNTSVGSGADTQSNEEVCPPGLVVYGGHVTLARSDPSRSSVLDATVSDDGTEWSAFARTYVSDPDWSLNAYALCPEPGAGASALAALAALGATARHRRRGFASAAPDV